MRAIRTAGDRVRRPGRSAPSERDLVAVAFLTGATVGTVSGFLAALAFAAVIAAGTAYAVRRERTRNREGRR